MTFPVLTFLKESNSRSNSIHSKYSTGKSGSSSGNCPWPPYVYNLLDDINNLKLHSQLKIYADYLALLHSHKDIELLETEAESGLKSISSYLSSNNLTSNNSRTKKIFLHNKKIVP